LILFRHRPCKLQTSLHMPGSGGHLR
jgi:hypothetical protein